MPKEGVINNPNGRGKGVIGKRSQAIIDKLKKLNCDPITGMAKIAMAQRIAKETCECGKEVAFVIDVDNQLRQQCYKELAQYIAPKLKAVEISTDEDTHESLLKYLASRAAS